MSLEALAGLCCDVEPAFDKTSAKNPEILNRLPLSRHSSNDSASSVGAVYAAMSRQQNSPIEGQIAAPSLSRQMSNGSRTNNCDWIRQVTLEERTFIRDKIKNAYKKRAPAYEDLLDICSAIDEELLFGNAPSRLDYFKSGVQFEKRVHEKVSQIQSGIIAGVSVNSNTDDAASARDSKKMKL